MARLVVVLCKVCFLILPRSLPYLNRGTGASGNRAGSQGFASGCVELQPDDRYSRRKVVPGMYRGMCRQRTNHVLVAHCMV